MIGAWATEYVMQDDNKDDEDFLMIRMTDVEYKFAERLCLLLMLCYSVWCSMYYYLLCNYQPDDIVIFGYLSVVYVAFLVWPIF